MVAEASRNIKRITKPSSKRLAFILVLAVIVLSLLLVLLLADVTAYAVRYHMRITEGSASHKYLMRELAHVQISTYLFNITNAEAFAAGTDHKLKMQEVGPFTYVENRKNVDIQFDLEAGVMRYTPVVNLTFQPELSIARPEDVMVTMPNIPMLGLSSIMNEYGVLACVGFGVLARQIQSKAIVTMNADVYMWGYHEPIISIGHTFIPGFIPFDKMGIMERLYAKDNDNHMELSATDDSRFMIKTRNGYTKLGMSPVVDPEECEKCNTFENTYEGIMYPTGLTPEFPLRIFRNGLCRVLEMEYRETITMDYGGDALVYHLSDKFYTIDPNETSTGIMELPDCFYGMPLALSKPHFLDVDPKIYERIEGLQPDKTYKSHVILEPLLGVELQTTCSVQINLVLRDLSHNPETASYSNMVIPIGYMKFVQPDLPEDIIALMTLLYTTGPYILLAVQMLFYLLTLITWAYFAILLYRYCAYSEDLHMEFTFTSSELVKKPSIEPQNGINKSTKYDS